MHVNNLIRPFKKLVDDNKIVLLVAVDVSYLSKEEQETVYKVIDKRYDKNIIRVPRQKMGESERMPGFSGFVKFEKGNVLRFYTKKK